MENSNMLLDSIESLLQEKESPYKNIFMSQLKTDTMEQKWYVIGISLYSDDLYPDDYEDGQENSYYMNKEEYEKFLSNKFESSEDMHNWFMNNIDNSNIYLAKEFVNEIASLDELVFDYHTQESIIKY